MEEESKKCMRYCSYMTHLGYFTIVIIFIHRIYFSTYNISIVLRVHFYGHMITKKTIKFSEMKLDD